MFKVKSKKWLVAGLVLTLVLVLGAGAATAANTAPGQAGNGLREFFISRLADNLGVDVTQLEQAFKQSALETVEQAVSQGVINQDKADQIKQAIENGNWNRLGFFLGPQFGKKPAGKMPLGGFGINPAAIASALGMTPADLASEFKNGKTLADIAQEKGITLDQLNEKIIDQEKQRLDQMVADGKMTQDAENKILSRLQQIDLSKFGKFGGRQGKNFPAPQKSSSQL